MMLKACRSRAAAATAGLAVIAGLAACGTQPGSAGSSRSAGASAPQQVTTVHLGVAFSPAALQLKVGQQFLVTVSTSVRVTGLPAPGGCAGGSTQSAGGGLLSARCTGAGYLYTAQQRGVANVSAGVRPRCAPGTMCPQWVSAPTLKITIS
ncbi:MAG: hypothetical protein J2P27_02015 [Actinobacteria bacterium]|nr:hypothetical protein [Actinomycetota bacterium]